MRLSDSWVALTSVSASDIGNQGMLELHNKWQPYTHDEAQLLNLLTDFTGANKYPDPICNRHLQWDNIKFDIVDVVEKLNARRNQ